MPLPIKIIFAPHAASLMQFKNVSGAPQASTQTSKPLPFVNSSQVVCKSHSLLKAFFASSTKVVKCCNYYSFLKIFKFLLFCTLPEYRIGDFNYI